MYNKVYVEITNICNMNCSFCHGHSRAPRQMSIDEFAVILFDIDKDVAEEKKRLFEEELKAFNQKNNEEALYLQMASGIAVYDPEIDQDYMEVFRRADEAMYNNKKEKKNKQF